MRLNLYSKEGNGSLFNSPTVQQSHLIKKKREESRFRLLLLSAKAESVDQFTVTLNIVFTKILQQVTAASNHFEETAT